jgi:hypothetical protein
MVQERTKEKMYLIIKKYSYDTLSPTFTVVYSTEDYQDAMHKILAYKVLKKENETLKIVSFPEVVVEEKSEKQKTLFG